MENQKIYFKVGDTVYCAIHGKGTVVEINPSEFLYPISVKFEEDEMTYTFDGRYVSNSRIVLSQNPISEVINTPISLFKKGELVWVRKSLTSTWKAAYFSHKDRGFFCCFVNQKKEGKTLSWKYCVPFNPLPF